MSAWIIAIKCAASFLFVGWLLERAEKVIKEAIDKNPEQDMRRELNWVHIGMVFCLLGLAASLLALIWLV